MIGRELKGEEGIRFVAVELEACPSMTKGEYRYDFGERGRCTPLECSH